MDDSRPVFVQVAESLSARILDGSMSAESQIPSINELAVFYSINPATALRGVNVLVEDGVLYKKRGIGMFVTADARQRLVDTRRAHFIQRFVRPMLSEASSLGIGSDELTTIVTKESGL